jgi:hypothetical protein
VEAKSLRTTIGSSAPCGEAAGQTAILQTLLGCLNAPGTRKESPMSSLRVDLIADHRRSLRPDGLKPW